MATAKAQRFGVRKIRFHGREWEARLIDARDRNSSESLARIGAINTTHGEIEVQYINRDQAVITMLHELMHGSMPGVKEAHIEMGDSMLKDALEAFGVDLSPLLAGFK